jgi:hypothetical protein
MKNYQKGHLYFLGVALSLNTRLAAATYGGFAGLKRLSSKFTGLVVFALLLTTILRHPLVTNASTLVIPQLEVSTPTSPENGPILPTIQDNEPKSPAAEMKPIRSFKAVKTQYSRADSCHYKRNGVCLMASGKGVYEGAVACPKFLALGTVVKIEGKLYTCEDRYATRLDKHRGLPTVDIFVESNPRGREVVEVSVMSLPGAIPAKAPAAVLLANK